MSELKALPDAQVAGFFVSSVQTPAPLAYATNQLVTKQDAVGTGAGSWLGRVGTGNLASGVNSAVAAGADNQASGENAFVGAGRYNAAQGLSSLVIGGFDNQATSVDAMVGAGAGNRATGARSIVVGGGLQPGLRRFQLCRRRWA